jgi:hypothetical protein
MTIPPARLPAPWRLPVLAAAGLSLLGGLYAALLLLGTSLPSPAAPVEQAHGPVMVFGVAGTLIALERAVALGRRWTPPAPACSGLSTRWRPTYGRHSSRCGPSNRQAEQPEAVMFNGYPA